MKPEEIKIGGVYDVRVKVMKKIAAPARGNLEIGAYTVDRTTQLPMEYEMSWFLDEESAAFVEINSENERKNSEPAPKYDPCRPYREGDKVRYVKRNGRFCPGSHAYERHLSLLGTVIRDEKPNYSVFVNFEHCADDYRIDPAYLELVTAVEELEPYGVTESTDYFAVYQRVTGDQLATFWKEWHPNPASAAAAECDRLNAEHIKETEQ